MARISEQIDIEHFDETLKKRALESSNPKWAELWAKRKGLLIDKQVKDTLEISPDDYLRISTTIFKELRKSIGEHGGICPVCGKPSSIPEQVCADTKQEHSTDSQVGSVGVPTKST